MRSGQSASRGQSGAGCRNRARGLSLLESLITMLLIGAFLVIASDLTIRFSAANSQSREVAQSLEIVNSVISQMKSDIMGAYRVNKPNALAQNTVELSVFKREETMASPTSRRLKLPVPLAASWQIGAAIDLTSVKYDQSGGWIRRSYASAAMNMGEVKDFKASLLRPGVFEVRLTIETTGRTQDLVGLVYKP